LGIDLSNISNRTDPTQGPTANDSCDPDAGPNNFQNYPVLSSVCHTGNTATVQGTLNSTPGTVFTIEFFANAACDSSGFGEGQTYLGSIQVITDANCTANFTFTGTTPAGQPFVTATATDPAGNTSEFSSCLTDVDSDGDGTADCHDSCPNDPNKISPGACGCGVADTDTDGDGIANCVDSCPLDAANDVDHDGICGNVDNCPFTFNPDQADSDHNGIGDACQSFTGPPVNKDQCKNGGWMTFDVPRHFKNQGDCIQYVNTGK
jgi:hypothetical protein